VPKIYDNIELKFETGLLSHLNDADSVDYCVGYFNLRGWRSVCDKIDDLKGACRLLVGMLKSPKELIREEFENPDNLMIDNEKANNYKKELALEFAEQLTIGSPTQQDENVLQMLLSQLKAGKVVIKLFLRHQLHAKLYLAHCPKLSNSPKLALLGSSNFTQSGLSGQGELNIDVTDEDAAIKFAKWFDDRWNDRWCIDITNDLIFVLENSWARPDKIPPYYVYLKMAYHLSQEARAGLAEFKLPKEFRKELLDFQQAAVKIAAHHLHKRNGVMIGDVVGLGKTITATAIAKLMEDDLFYNTLILCPKNLKAMWEHYRIKYGLHAEVREHSMIISDLPTLRRYKLIIIDESHNFRNSEGRRYKILKSYIEANESKVILLSATPYNKSYEDLASQLKLFLSDDTDLGISPERYIKELGGNIQFCAKHSDTNIRTIKAFEKSNFTDDWRDVMKLYLVRRTRSFIKNNYAKIAQNGRKYLEFADGTHSYFPDRIPKKVSFELDVKNKNDQYAQLYDDKVVSIIDKLNLPRYGLLTYHDDKSKVKLTDDERQILKNLSRAGKKVKGFCRTNLYKRLESSGYAFLLSVSRHILRNYIFIYALKNGLKLPIAGQSIDVDFYEDIDEETYENLNFDGFIIDYEKLGADNYKIFETQLSERFKWINSKIFDQNKLLKDLESDSSALLEILSNIKIWIPDLDRKLTVLYDLIMKQHKNEKVLIFTQFADTAEYIFKYLKNKNVKNMEFAIGGKDNITDIVTKFSPVSNEKSEICGTQDELRILITTDVLSEGQNLQDSHIVINFDLPWALVRLIQRAGRIDRLGQKSDKILCYSFLPEDGIEKIIKLRDKLKTRITQNAEVIGSDEIFFDGDPVNIADIYSEKSGIFDEPEDAEVDLASFAYQIWKNATDANPKLKKEIEALPNVVFSTKENTLEQNGNGVVVYARTSDNNDVLLWLDDNGDIVSQSQYKILKAAECQFNTYALEKLSNHHDLVKKGVEIIMQENNNISGTLGRPSSVKYRSYMTLKRYADDNAGTIFVTERLKRAIDDIFRYPLKEYAIDAISRQLKVGIPDAELAELVISLKDDDKLCNITEERENRMAQIICSLGLVKED